ncbi:MAG: endonuclease III [Bacteroidales bacterium]|jgi:endonuclease-3|nr:endonuclease III [Bacteroidales bacterium]MCI1785796.1 endonuclease III [Bacteroidales bacterium]
MDKAKRYEEIFRWFRENRPDPHTELKYANPFQLLVSVMLSAQCTDKRVNTVTPGIFAKYPDPKTMSNAEFDDIFPLVKSVSYPNSKARHLIGMAKKLMEDFNSVVPSGIAELMSLPGVGHKTANVIASIIYKEPVIAVDTHVFRVSHRLGLSDGKTADAVEKDLERFISPGTRTDAHHWLILHGRYTCTARSPKCGECGLKKWCRYYLSGNAGN